MVRGVTGVRVLLSCYCCYQDIKTLLMAVISWLTFPALKWENVWELPERSGGRTAVPRWDPLRTTQCPHHQSDIFSCTIPTLHYTTLHTIHLASFQWNLYAGSWRWPSADCLKSPEFWSSTKNASSIKGGGSIHAEIWAASLLPPPPLVMMVDTGRARQSGHWLYCSVPGSIILQPLNIMLSVVMKCCASGPLLTRLTCLGSNN